jgi:hypothetical protein
MDAARGKGKWLFSNREYCHWIENTGSNVLWIEGKPGSGKSTLTKLTVRRLEERAGESSQNITNFDPIDQIVAKFYYSFRGGNTEMSHTLMLRSIVWQIWNQNIRLFRFLQPCYREKMRNKIHREEREMSWSYKELKSILESLHQIDFILTVTIVIDGMDESDNEQRTDVLQFLSKLANHHSGCIKVLIASRPEGNINPHLSEAHHIVLEKENEVDIRAMLESWSPKDPGLSNEEVREEQEVFSEIRDYIRTNSRGVFLWVMQILKELDEFIYGGAWTRDQIFQLLRSLPTELGGPDGFYRRMVTKMDDRYWPRKDDVKERAQARQRRILSWVTFPKRPLLLYELRGALAVPFQPSSVSLEGYNYADHDPKRLEAGISCGGLVEVVVPKPLS